MVSFFLLFFFFKLVKKILKVKEKGELVSVVGVDSLSLSSLLLMSATLDSDYEFWRVFTDLQNNKGSTTARLSATSNNSNRPHYSLPEWRSYIKGLLCSCIWFSLISFMVPHCSPQQLSSTQCSTFQTDTLPSVLKAPVGNFYKNVIFTELLKTVTTVCPDSRI